MKQKKNITKKGESKMSMMCKKDQCKIKKGMCIHEKIMMSMVAVVIMAGLYYWMF